MQRLWMQHSAISVLLSMGNTGSIYKAVAALPSWQVCLPERALLIARRPCKQDKCQHTLQQGIQVGLHELEGCAHIVETLALHSSQGHT